MAGVGGVLCVQPAADGLREANQPGDSRNAAGDGDDRGSGAPTDPTGQRWVKELLDRLLADYFGEPEIEFQWKERVSR